MPKSISISGADRYNFMMALTSYLISNRQQPIEKVAAHFGVSEEELRKALVTISLSGVGRYRPDELFFLDYDLLEEGIVDLSFAPTLESAPRLSARQAAAIASGLSSLGALLNDSERGEINELLDLLSRGSVGDGEKLPVSIQPSEPNRELISVRAALSAGRAISCEYRNNSGEVRNRVIEPWVLESRDQEWFLRGWCQTHNESRVFRIDRMRHVVVMDEAITHHPDRESGGIYYERETDSEVLFEVDPEGFGFIADFLPEQDISGQDTVRVKVKIGNLDALGRIVCRYGGKVRVIEPPQARAKVLDFVQSLLGQANNLETVE